MKRITLSSSQSLVKYVVNPDHIMNIHGFSHDPVGCRIAFVDGSRLNVDETVQEVLDQLDSIPKVESFKTREDKQDIVDAINYAFQDAKLEARINHYEQIVIPGWGFEVIIHTDKEQGRFEGHYSDTSGG